MSHSVPSLFDGFEDLMPEPSGKPARKIRSRKDNEAIPFSEDSKIPEKKDPPPPQEAELQFEAAEANFPENSPKAPETEAPGEKAKPDVLQNDHLNYIHKELPSQAVIPKRHSVIVLEDIVHKKKDIPEPEAEDISIEHLEPSEKEPEITEEPESEEPPLPEWNPEDIVPEKKDIPEPEAEVEDISTGHLELSEKEPEIAEEQEAEDFTLPEWELEDKYYSIGEVARLFQVNTSHIRFWTSSFRLKPRTTRKGDRLYSKEDIRQLRLIHHLVKEKKHTIKGAQEKLKLQKQNVHSGLTLRDTLITLREKLAELRDGL